MNKVIMCLCATFFLCFSFSKELYADELSELKKQVETIQKKIEKLEAEVAQEKIKNLEAAADGIKLGGALELNYSYEKFKESSQGRGGNLNFGSLRLKADGSINDILLSVEYRFLTSMHFIRYGWIGYQVTDDLQVQLGITKVPFGILPYASHTFWESTAFPLGFEDDFDMGVKGVWKHGPWDAQVAFFKNDEYGDATKLGRYSADVVQDEGNFPGQANEEINQGNVRLTRTVSHGDLGSTELGMSGQFGGLRNSMTGSDGDHWAVAAHLNGDYGPFNIMLEAIQYDFNPPEVFGVDDGIVVIGAFDDAYAVAAEAFILVANVAYTIPSNVKPVKELTLYNDFSVLKKSADGYSDSYVNTIGVRINAHPLWIYVDAIMGKSSLYLGGPRDSYAAGGDNEKWHTRFNINAAYYF